MALSYQTLFNETSINVDQIQTNRILVLDGSASSPSISFILDPTTGLERSGSGEMSFTSAGTAVIKLNSTGMSLLNSAKILNSDGSSTSPSYTFASDTDTGVYKNSPFDTLSVTKDGVEAFRFGNTLNTSLLPFYCAGTMSCSPYSFSCGTISIFGSISSSGSAALGGPLSCPSITCGSILSGQINTQGYSITSGTIDTQGNTITCGTIFNTNGSAVNPCYTFGSDTTIGLFKSGVVTLGIASNGIEAMKINYSIAQFNVPVALGGNTLNSGAITSTGDFTNGTHNLTTNNIVCNNITSTGSFSLTNILLGDGSNTVPSLAFTNETKTGLARLNANTLSLLSQGTECLRINFAGCQFLNNLSMQSNTLSTTGTITTSGTVTLSYANTKSFVYCDSSKNLVSTASTTDGQILIGSSSGVPAPARILGTAHQVFVTSGPNSIQLSGPQNLDVPSTPSFTKLYLIGTNTLVNAGYNTLQLNGTDSSSSASSIQYFTTVDNFPNMQLLGYTHNNINLSFDSYYDGSWKSGSTTSNYQISKNNNKLNINYSPSTTAGSALTWNSGIVMNDSGQVIIGNTTTNASGTARLQLYGINNSSTSPSTAYYTDQDNLPNLNINGLQHNNINLNFDAY